MAQVNDGDYLQAKLYSALADYVRYQPGFKYRFYDTKSTRGSFLPAQPGDFFLLVPEACFLIECKSSVAGVSLLSMAFKGAVGKNQIAKHRMWHRAGHPSLYLYLDLASNRIEWHTGVNVVNKKNQPVWTGQLSDLSDSLIAVIRTIPIPSKDRSNAVNRSVYPCESKNLQHPAVSSR
jgi:hypothetical protein